MENTRNRAAVMIMSIAILIAGAFMIIAAQSHVHAAGENGKNAMELKLNTAYLNETIQPADSASKYYKFKTGSKKAKYRILIQNKGKSAIQYWVLDENCEDTIPFNNQNNTLSPRSDKYADYSIANYGYLKKNTWYCLQIKNKGQSTAQYDLKIAESVSKPSKAVIKKVSAKKKQIKVLWKHAEGAKAYQVSIKKAGGKWITKTTTSTKYAFKKLKSKKRYSVKVRGYFNYKGKTYFGKWSVKRSVAVK